MDEDRIGLFWETIARVSRMERPEEIDAYLAERRHRRQVLALHEQMFIFQHARYLRARDDWRIAAAWRA